MARPLKTGLDYFPLDTVFDDKIDILEVECGLEGFAIFIKLLQKIYRNGYYYPWNGREGKLLSRVINVDINVVSSVVNVCINEDIFNKDIYEKYYILTSTGIQKRFFNAVSRRKSIDIISEYILIDINVYINPAQTTLMSTSCIHKPRSVGINASRSTQSKVKKSKEKNIKSTDLVPKTEPSKEFYHSIKDAFESKHGEFDNYGREGKHINGLIEKAKKRFPEDPPGFIKKVLEAFWTLKKTGNDFWKGQPFLPSVLNSSSIWPRVLEQMREQEDEDIDEELLKEIFPE